MKAIHQTLYFVIITLLFSTTLNASQDASVKKQCQHIVYGYGEFNYTFDALLIGYMNGILYATPPNYKTNFSKRARGETIIRKACHNALNNITVNGFEADYRWQLLKLINNKYKHR
ncbi:MAG: hypothetical protein U9N59_14520, partial [Campylobacterota bacterium]|nr:hypothetical protein [Campylobacterota bacterium]